MKKKECTNMCFYNSFITYQVCSIIISARGWPVLFSFNSISGTILINPVRKILPPVLFAELTDHIFGAGMSQFRSFFPIGTGGGFIVEIQIGKATVEQCDVVFGVQM